MPTPQAHNAKENDSPAQVGRHTPDLGAINDLLLPTPTVEHAARSRSVVDRDPNSLAHIGTTLQDWCEEVNALLPTPKADDGRAGSPNNKGSAGDLTLPSAALALLPTPDAQMGGAGGRSGDPELRRAAGRTVTINEVAQNLPGWGPYKPAIRRWEAILGRTAPWATEPSVRSKKGRLSPKFVEWMMGWRIGWVTSLTLSRNQQLRILGNGVVPQQAEAAVRFLLAPPSHREPPKRRPRKGLRRATPSAMLRASRKLGENE